MKVENVLLTLGAPALVPAELDAPAVGAKLLLDLKRNIHPLSRVSFCDRTFKAMDFFQIAT